ncbi:MAG: hypothetical protein ABJN96_01270 [Marinomonas sp.]
MKMKDQLDSPQPLKKHKAKSKKAESKKKKQAKIESKKQSKEKKVSKTKETTPIIEQPAAAPSSKKTVKPAPTKQAAPEEKKAPEVKPEPAQVATPTPEELTTAVTTPSTESLARSRVSKSLEPMSKEDQLVAVNQIIKRLLLNEISQGEALRELRVNVLRLRQEAYTELTGVSRKTLSEIENDKGNYTPEIINKVFKPFELKSSLVPTSSQLLVAILSS